MRLRDNYNDSTQQLDRGTIQAQAERKVSKRRIQYILFKAHM